MISSFTVLLPGLFESLQNGQTLVTITGVVFVTAGLWTVNIDLDKVRHLAATDNGYVSLLPIVFVALDTYSTLINLSLNSGTVELNPFVASVVQDGSGAIIPFLISYIALSQGLALLMLKTGAWLFGSSRSLRILPFALICGASSFGPFSNLLGLAVGYTTLLAYLVAITASASLVGVILRILKGTIALSRLAAQ